MNGKGTSKILSATYGHSSFLSCGVSYWFGQRRLKDRDKCTAALSNTRTSNIGKRIGGRSIDGHSKRSADVNWHAQIYPKKFLHTSMRVEDSAPRDTGGKGSVETEQKVRVDESREAEDAETVEQEEESCASECHEVKMPNIEGVQVNLYGARIFDLQRLQTRPLLNACREQKLQTG